MSQSSSSRTADNFYFRVSDHPRELTHIHESDTSPLRDLSFADTRMFPQAVVHYIETHHDLCEHYGLFPEYLPYVGLRQTIAPTDSPLFIKHIYSLCHQQLSVFQEPTEIEV
jgi:hypothetical protein